MKIYLHTLMRGLILVIAAVATLVLSGGGSISALEADQRSLMRHGVRYFNISEGMPCAAGPATGTITIEGSDDAERVYNFLVSKGWTPFQAAGIMGNMHVESGIQPMRLQGTASGVRTPAETVGSRNTGWGLVQWTPASKFISTQNPTSAANEIGNQLQFLQDQLEGRTTSPEARAGQELRSTTSLEQAVLAFQGGPSQRVGNVVVGPYFGYERPADKIGSVSIRYNAARGYLAQYGSNAPTTDPTSTTNPAPSDCPGGATDGGGGSTNIETGDVAELARRLGTHPNISFQTTAGERAFGIIQQTGRATQCNAPQISATLLGVLLKLAESYRIVLGVFVDGHGCDSGFHPRGAAVDINGVNYIDGREGTGNNIRFEPNELPILREFYKRAGEVLAANGGGGLGEQNCFGGSAPKVTGVTYFNDTCNHLHMDTRGR